MATEKRRGAPKKAVKELKDAHITAWMTRAQKALIEEAANADGDLPASFVRKASVRAAEAVLGESKKR